MLFSVLRVQLSFCKWDFHYGRQFFNSVIEEDYLQSQSFVQESERLVGELTRLIGEYKNEEHILNGGSISEEEMRILKIIYITNTFSQLVNIIQIYQKRKTSNF